MSILAFLSQQPSNDKASSKTVKENSRKEGNQICSKSIKQKDFLDEPKKGTSDVDENESDLATAKFASPNQKVTKQPKNIIKN